MIDELPNFCSALCGVLVFTFGIFVFVLEGNDADCEACLDRGACVVDDTEGCLELGMPVCGESSNGTLVVEGLAEIDPLCFWFGT